MSADAQVNIPKKGLSAATDPGVGRWSMIVDTENGDVPTVLLGTGGVPTPVPLSLALSEISPAQSTGNENDYAPAGLPTAHIIRLDADGAYDLTGLDSTGVAATAKKKTLLNVSAFNRTVKHQSLSSLAGNRILSATGVDLVLAPDNSLDLYLDSTTSRWRTV